MVSQITIGRRRQGAGIPNAFRKLLMNIGASEQRPQANKIVVYLTCLCANEPTPDRAEKG
jgi:hypothetical protein